MLKALFRFFGKILLNTLTLFLSLGLFAFICISIFTHKDGEKSIELPESFFLSIDFNIPIQETPKAISLDFLQKDTSSSLLDITKAISDATNDDRVKGLYATITHTPLSLSEIQSIHRALTEFKKSGKPTLIFSESFGEISNSSLNFTLASAFEKIWLQPSGTLNLEKLSIEQPFFHSLLEEYGIKPQFSQRYEFKGAMESFTNKKFSEPVDNSLARLLDSFQNQIEETLTTNLSLPKEKLDEYSTKSPILSSEAKAFSLVHHLGYKDEFEDYIKNIYNEKKDYKTVSLNQYSQSLKNKPNSKDDTKNEIAIIYAVGPIVSGSNNKGFNENPMIWSDELAKSIQEARERKNVKAIILRVDSPGGSYLASDTIWREMVLSEQTEKPIIASLGNIAASGGYYIAHPADHIFLENGSITGSIGVIGGKFVLKDFFKKINIDWDSISTDKNISPMWSILNEFSENQWKQFNKFLDFAYDDFTSKVAKYRKLSEFEIDSIARGRVWSGRDAIELGLADEVGDLNTAVKKASELAKVDKYKIVYYPKPETPIEFLSHFLKGSVSLSNFLNSQIYEDMLLKMNDAYIEAKDPSKVKLRDYRF